MLITESNQCSFIIPRVYLQAVTKVLLASAMCFAAPNLYAAQATDSGTHTNTANTIQTGSEQKDRKRLLSINRIKRFMDEGSTTNIEKMIEQHLEQFPDDPNAYGQLSRIIMKLGAVSDDSLLGYHYKKEADTPALDALNTALTLDPNNAEELSRLGHLHAVQGRHEDALRAFEKVRQLKETPAWLNFNEAIMHVGREKFTQAAASLQPLTSTRPPDNSRVAWNIYRSAWNLRTALALAHPETDPVPSVSSGTMRRIPIHTLYDEAARSPSSDKPTIIFVASSDSGCGACKTDLARMEEAADALGDGYELIYTSVEPWNDINKHTLALRAFKITGVPTQILMYKGQHLGTIAGALSPEKIQNYKNAEPNILNGGHKTTRLRPYDELLKLDINYRVKAAIDKRAKYSAAAVTVEGRSWASGIAGGSATQAQANDDAMARCKSNAKSRGIKSACSIYSVSQ